MRGRQCTCRPGDIRRYFGRISGPLLDRIDLQLTVERPDFDVVDGDGQPGEPSAAIARRVARARAVQAERFWVDHRNGHPKTNGRMTPQDLARFCRLDRAGRELLKQAYHRLGLSIRTHHRLLKVARTIADLDGGERIEADHLAEALRYRMLDLRRSGE